MRPSIRRCWATTPGRRSTTPRGSSSTAASPRARAATTPRRGSSRWPVSGSRSRTGSASTSRERGGPALTRWRRRRRSCSARLVRLLWPGREVLHLAAVVFFAVCPVMMKAAAMVHPEPLSMLLSTARARPRRPAARPLRPPARHARALGSCLGLAQLVRAWTLWTSASSSPCSWSPSPPAGDAVASARSRSRRRRLLVPAPWYAHQAAPLRQPGLRPARTRRAALVAPSARFFVGPGLPAGLTRPTGRRSRTRSSRSPTRSWGDYFGVWRWFPGRGPTVGVVGASSCADVARRLPFTLLALAGWLALLGLAVRIPGRRPSAARRSPAARSLAGVVYFSTAYPTRTATR